MVLLRLKGMWIVETMRSLKDHGCDKWEQMVLVIVHMCCAVTKKQSLFQKHKEVSACHREWKLAPRKVIIIS